MSLTLEIVFALWLPVSKVRVWNIAITNYSHFQPGLDY